MLEALADREEAVTAFDRFPCMFCRTLHVPGECRLLTEPLAVMLPEWLDKRLREQVPKGQRAAFVRRLLEENLQ